MRFLSCRGLSCLTQCLVCREIFSYDLKANKKISIFNEACSGVLGGGLSIDMCKQNLNNIPQNCIFASYDQLACIESMSSCVPMWTLYHNHLLAYYSSPLHQASFLKLDFLCIFKWGCIFWPLMGLIVFLYAFLYFSKE